MSTDNIQLEILVPTYQRAAVLLQNMEMLAALIRVEGKGRIAVRIRDNASSDGTIESLLKFASENGDIEWKIDRNDQNIGGEPNCLVLLESSEAEFIMYLGDDDFLPTGYLRFVLDELEANPNLSVVVTGIDEINENGTITPSRFESFDLKRFKPGPEAVREMMPLGHQLSGMVLRREGTAESYLDTVSARNLYPFIYFIGYNCRTGDSIYIPEIKVLVTIGTKKYWNYDWSNLMRDVFINYEAIYRGQPRQRVRSQFTFLRRNWGRIGGNNLLRLPMAYCHLTFWWRLDLLTRSLLLLLLPWLIIRSAIYSVARVFGEVYRRASR